MKVYRIGFKTGQPIDVHAPSPREARAKLLNYFRDELHYSEESIEYIRSQMKKPRLV